jgi:integrase
MTRIPTLPGVHRVIVRGRAYYYAYRGGPRLPDPKDAAAFAAAYAAALAAHTAPRTPPKDSIEALAADYRASSHWIKLSAEVKRTRTYDLDVILEAFAGLPIRALGDPQMRVVVADWRDQRAATPRMADRLVATLACLAAHAVRRGLIAVSAVTGIEQLGQADRSAIIWAPDEIEAVLARLPATARAMTTLAVYSGLRMGDLCDLRWRDVDEAAGVIDRATNKSKGRARAIVPILPEAQSVLDSQPRDRLHVFHTYADRPWTTSGLGSAFRTARNICGYSKHFHDLRGTAATMFASAGYSADEIAGFLGWEPQRAREIIRRYVTKRAVALAAVERLKRAKSD